MKVVILAGGKGTRISEETQNIPKPMIEIGGKPILWHIMKIYSHYGFHDFIICLGYLGYVIKEYFSHYFLHMSDMTLDMSKNKTIIHNTVSEPWKVTLVDTGSDTMTGGRLKRIEKYIGNETFMMTYGDGVADINIKELIKVHRQSKKLATLTAIQTAGRFGVLDIEKNNNVKTFLEKPKGEGSWINSGFFVLEPEVFDFIEKDDSTIWEREPLENIAKKNQLNSYKHSGFWECMDTYKDNLKLNELWFSARAPWKLWRGD